MVPPIYTSMIVKNEDALQPKMENVIYYKIYPEGAILNKILNIIEI